MTTQLRGHGVVTLKAVSVIRRCCDYLLCTPSEETSD